MIYHPCNGIIHKLNKKLNSPSFPSSVPQFQKKCRKNIQNGNTKYICEIFQFVIFNRDGFFFSLVLLFCAVLLVTVLFLFQKAAINNTLISKECLCDFMLWN